MFKMRDELYYFDIYPKVVPVGKSVCITIRSLSCHTDFKPDERYNVTVLPVNGEYYPSDTEAVVSASVHPVNSTISFTHCFESEQEYHVRITQPPDFKKSKNKACLSVYAVEKDLLERVPLMGDFHAHTCFSDGKESPEMVAAMYRREGFDFVAITDHRKYHPSIRAIDAYKELGLDFVIYPGEEIHTPGSHVHLVNFASDFSVNDCFLSNKDAEGIDWDDKGTPTWNAKIEKRMKELGELPDGIDRFVHASCLWAIDKVREGHGMCILAHPHWLRNVRNLPDYFTMHYLENGFADALELTGGQTAGENMTQLALYHECRANGLKIPVVSSSDSHGTVNRKYFTESKTIVFAADNTRDSIISAVKDLYSVSVVQYLNQDFQIFGPYRLVNFALFLQQEYFPLHHELCFEEGRLMRAYISKDKSAKPRLNALKGQTQRLYMKYFYDDK